MTSDGRGGGCVREWEEKKQDLTWMSVNLEEREYKMHFV